MDKPSTPSFILQSCPPERHAVVPVRGEVADVQVWDHGLQPSQHQFLGRELGLADLVSQDQVPYQTQDQLQAAVHNVFTSCKDRELEIGKQQVVVYLFLLVPVGEQSAILDSSAHYSCLISSWCEQTLK